CSATEHPDLFDAARIGLGALGVVTAVTFAVEPAFLLRAVELPMRWDDVLADLDGLSTRNEHFELYWFPHTEHCLTKQNHRTGGCPGCAGGGTTSSWPTRCSVATPGWPGGCPR